MHVAIAQINSVVGALAENSKKIYDAYIAACKNGAQLVVTPGLSLTGSPLHDLVRNNDFVAKVDQALDSLSKQVGQVPLVVGTLTKRFAEKQTTGAAVLRQGRVQTFYPGWTDGLLPLPSDIVMKDNSIILLRKGALTSTDLIVMCASWPWRKGEDAERLQALAEYSRAVNLPIVVANAVGGGGECVFYGQSLILGCDGNVLYMAKSFEEEVGGCDLKSASAITLTSESVVAKTFKALALGTRDFVKKNGFEKVVLGLSGGIDSATVATIATEALGSENVLCVALPSRYSSKSSLTDAEALAENLGVNFEVISIEELFSEWECTVAPVFEGLPADVTEENVQARLRGVVLMSLSNKFNSLLLNTGNKSEVATGYCTLYGDTCGALSVIGDLYKMEVYELARWINSKRAVIPNSILDKAPSAELRPGQTDQDTLPPYEILDGILRLFLEENLTVEEISTRGYDRKTVVDVINRVYKAAFKRAQGPPILRISKHGLDVIAKLPLIQRFVFS